MRQKRWFDFSLNAGRYWSVGVDEFGFHFRVPLFAISRWSRNVPAEHRTGWDGWNLAFWPTFPSGQGSYLFKFHT